MSMYRYFIEAWGVIVILYAKVLTDADPIILGFTYFACLFFAKGITTSYFSPMSGILSYSMGRMPLDDLVYNVLAQLLGTLAVIITYMPVHSLTMKEYVL